MTSQLDIRTKDLRRLCAVVGQAQQPEQPAERFPTSVLEALRDLVPCDDITYQVMDPSRESVIYLQELADDQTCLEPDEERLTTFFWRSFWASQACSYPQRTGDFVSVRRVTDFYSAREFAASDLGELFRLYGMRYETLVPLTPDGVIDYRILLWRADGPDFSPRELLLLALLRPHLAELDLALRQPPIDAPLTNRQAQLLDLVAEGLTNRQIAKRLTLSEGTVRRHLENIFERLGVNSRTAAAAYATKRRPAPRRPEFAS